MFSKLYKFSKFVMYLNSCSMDLGRDSSYCGLCESLVRSSRSFPSHKFRVFKEKKFSTP